MRINASALLLVPSDLGAVADPVVDDGHEEGEAGGEQSSPEEPELGARCSEESCAEEIQPEDEEGERNDEDDDVSERC